MYNTKLLTRKGFFITMNKFDLIDKAAWGDIEAAGLLAEGYQTGKYECEKNLAKAKKWATYAAKHGDERAKKVLETL